MKEFFEKHNELKSYPEFDLEEIREKHKYWLEMGEDGDGEWRYPDWIFNPKLAFEYVLLVYAPDSSLANIEDLAVRKKKALSMSKIPKEQHEAILSHRNAMVGDMVTRLFRVIKDFDYELYISGQEAIATLLEVVRKPIDTRLQDDKERNAVKAKRECFEDAQVIGKKVKEIFKEMHDIHEDLAAANESVFKGGTAERLAQKSREK